MRTALGMGLGLGLGGKKAANGGPPPPFTPSLIFSDPRNSQYVALVLEDI